MLVTHEDEIGRACDRIIRIRDGILVSDGLEAQDVGSPPKIGPEPTVSIT